MKDADWLALTDERQRDHWERKNYQPEAEYDFACRYLVSCANWVADGSNLNDPPLDYGEWWEYPGEEDPRSKHLRPEDWGAWRAERVQRRWESRLANRAAWQSEQAAKRAATAQAAAERLASLPPSKSESSIADDWIDDPHT